jgi:hypothetical protein
MRHMASSSTRTTAFMIRLPATPNMQARLIDMGGTMKARTPLARIRRTLGTERAKKTALTTDVLQRVLHRIAPRSSAG